MFRLFVALDIPDEIRRTLASLSVGLPGARWTRPENYHLTLRFIGEVDRAGRDELESALSRLFVPAFSLSLEGLGHWESKGKPRVLWAGITPSSALDHLHQRVEAAVVAAGFSPERRRFKPHITLARLSGTSDAQLSEWLGLNPLPRMEPFEVGTFTVYRSFLKKDGPVYRPEYSIPLEGGRSEWDDESFSGFDELYGDDIGLDDEFDAEKDNPPPWSSLAYGARTSV